MKKIQRQESDPTRMPPSSTPGHAAEPGDAAPHAQRPVPLGALRERRHQDRQRRRRDDRRADALDRPRRRSGTRWTAPGRMPATPLANTTSPIRNTRLRPTRSAVRPPSSSSPPNVMAYAVRTHWMFSDENFRAPWMVGSATLMIDDVEHHHELGRAQQDQRDELAPFRERLRAGRLHSSPLSFSPSQPAVAGRTNTMISQPPDTPGHSVGRQMDDTELPGVRAVRGWMPRTGAVTAVAWGR